MYLYINQRYFHLNIFQRKKENYNSIFQSSSSLLESVNYMVQRTNLTNIIYIGNIDKNILESRPSETYLYFIGNRELLKEKEIKDLTIINHNIAEGLPRLDRKILENSVVVVDSVIENLNNPNPFLKGLSKWSKVVPSIFLSTPNNIKSLSESSWSISDLKEELNRLGFKGGFYGYIPRELYEEKTEILYIGGKLSNFSHKNKELKICAIISTSNEEDIIEQVCKYLLSQNVDVHVIDNWSTDQTLNIVKKLSENDRRITYEIFPEKDIKQHTWFDMLARKVEYSLSNEYDWYIHYDADEMREGCFSYSIKKEISFVDSLGFNAIDHTVIDFRPTKEGFIKGTDPEEYFTYFEFGGRPGHFVQIKAWKKIPGIAYDLSTSGGHSISFEGKRVYPYKFLLKHYPIRSLEHMKRKILIDRLPRYEKGKKELGWHTHYDKYSNLKKFNLWKKENLLEWRDDFKERYLLERLFGVNIQKEKTDE